MVEETRKTLLNTVTGVIGAAAFATLALLVAGWFSRTDLSALLQNNWWVIALGAVSGGVVRFITHTTRPGSAA